MAVSLRGLSGAQCQQSHDMRLRASFNLPLLLETDSHPVLVLAGSVLSPLPSTG